jgi:hypothetical protein
MWAVQGIAEHAQSHGAGATNILLAKGTAGILIIAFTNLMFEYTDL